MRDKQAAPPAPAPTVVVVGAGVIGCSIARELTRYTPDVVILEKESDVADGTSKANNAEVHSGIGEKRGTLKQKLNVRGNQMYDDFVRASASTSSARGCSSWSPRSRSRRRTPRSHAPDPAGMISSRRSMPQAIILTGRRGNPGPAVA